jgi:hypothetical protein
MNVNKGVNDCPLWNDESYQFLLKEAADYVKTRKRKRCKRALVYGHPASPTSSGAGKSLAGWHKEEYVLSYMGRSA